MRVGDAPAVISAVAVERAGHLIFHADGEPLDVIGERGCDAHYLVYVPIAAHIYHVIGDERAAAAEVFHVAREESRHETLSVCGVNPRDGRGEGGVGAAAIGVPGCHAVA